MKNNTETRKAETMKTNAQYAAEARERMQQRCVARLRQVARQTAEKQGISYDEALKRTAAAFVDQWPTLAATIIN